MKKLLTILCLVFLSSCSQEPEVVQEPEVITGPFLFRDGVTYHQDTNEPITGTVVSFYDNGQLRWRENYKDGNRDGLSERFYENGQLQVISN
jgi:antitoxin component YwqK of YwqJK toxin-antitoxin module